MITTKKLLSVTAIGLATLVASLSASAEENSASMLGKRYAGVDLSINDYHDTPDNGYGIGLSVHQPVSSQVDASFGYGYGWVNGSNYDITSHGIGAGLTIFNRQDGYSPFVKASLGYQWDEVDFASNAIPDDRDEYFHYFVGIGVEVPVGPATAITGTLGYAAAVDRPGSGDEDYFEIDLSASHWINEKFAITGGVEVSEDVATTFWLGGRFKF